MSCFAACSPQLGLMVTAGAADHLDSLDARYWLTLEWRALRAALAAADDAARRTALADALAFRAARRCSVSRHRRDRERRRDPRRPRTVHGRRRDGGIAGSRRAGRPSSSLTNAEREATFVRTFAYASGPRRTGCCSTRSIRTGAEATASSSRSRRPRRRGRRCRRRRPTRPAPRLATTALRCARSEERRELDRQARVAELTRRFIDGPVVTFPRARSASLITTGAAPIPGRRRRVHDLPRRRPSGELST